MATAVAKNLRLRYILQLGIDYVPLPHSVPFSHSAREVCGDSWQQLEGCSGSVPTTALVGTREEGARPVGGGCRTLFLCVSPEKGREKKRPRWDGKEGWVQVCACAACQQK